MQHAAIDANERPKRKPKKRGATRFPGIVEDARALGCHRNTLFRALTGQWRLPGLVGRYKELKRNQRKTGKRDQIDQILNQEAAR